MRTRKKSALVSDSNAYSLEHATFARIHRTVFSVVLTAAPAVCVCCQGYMHDCGTGHSNMDDSDAGDANEWWESSDEEVQRPVRKKQGGEADAGVPAKKVSCVCE